MAVVGVNIGFKVAWWINTTLWLAFPLHLISERAADAYCKWIIDRAVKPYVR